MRLAAIRKRMAERSARNQNPRYVFFRPDAALEPSALSITYPPPCLTFRMRVIGVDVAGLDAQVCPRPSLSLSVRSTATRLTALSRRLSRLRRRRR